MQRFIYIVSAGILPLPLWAAQCVADPLAAYTQMGGNPHDKRIHVQADNSESDFAIAQFTGSVNVRQGDKHLFAPKVNYDRDAGLLTGEQGITLGMPTAAVSGEGGQYRLNEDVVTFQRADYYIVAKDENGSSAKGRAEDAEFNRQTNVDTFKAVTWTTCERQSPVWQVKADALTLNHNTNIGVAKDATFRIKDTPVFWLPYFSFPIGHQRATGFLMPSLASSEERGFEAVIPFYWNIASHMDATFALHPMTKRGLMLDGEYRFLTQSSQGKVSGSFLPRDSASEHGKRWRIGGEYVYRLPQNWRFDVNYQGVSDVNYLADINSGLNLFDDWYLERHARLTGSGDWGKVVFQTQHYKRVSADVTDADTPYSRLPQLFYSNSWHIGHFTLGILGEGVRFQKHHYGDASRFQIEPSMSYRFDRPYGYLEPTVSLNLRHYAFHPDNQAFRTGSKNLVVPTVSLDGKLIFERSIHAGDADYTQTLEPQLFYLYSPYRHQNDIPLFDTSEQSLSWSGLFARNRFLGSDRIGDANQLTTALTTRFYRNSDGQEKFRFSLGQIQYFRDRKLQLNSTTPIKSNKSVIVSEANYQIDKHWSLYGLSFWDPNKQRNERDIVDLRYTLDADRYIQFGHRYNRDDYDQLSLAGGWRIRSDWRVFARQDYSIRHHRGINTMFGVEYNDCCWAWRLAGRNYRNHPNDEKSHNAVYLEFIFKGLGNMGSSTGGLLKDQLYNFKPLPQERTL